MGEEENGLIVERFTPWTSGQGLFCCSSRKNKILFSRVDAFLNILMTILKVTGFIILIILGLLFRSCLYRNRYWK